MFIFRKSKVFLKWLGQMVFALRAKNNEGEPLQLYIQWLWFYTPSYQGGGIQFWQENSSGSSHKKEIPSSCIIKQISVEKNHKTENLCEILPTTTNVRRLGSVNNCPCKIMVTVGPYLTYHDHFVWKGVLKHINTFVWPLMWKSWKEIIFGL